MGAVFLLFLRHLSILFVLLFLVACEGPYGSRSMQELQSLSIKAHMPCKVYEHAHYFIYGCASNRVQNASDLTIVIEGDGLAWRTSDEISQDPTPRVPVGMEVASGMNRSTEILYLARPGQYIYTPQQNPKDWTRARFSKGIVQAYSQIINTMHAQRVHLMGYSGGAALAVLLVPHIKGIASVTTFAGVLDHQAWTTFHDYSPLKDSLNPPDFLHDPVYQGVKFTHYYGLGDENVTPELVQGFKKQWAPIHGAKFIELPGVDHSGPWDRLFFTSD